VGSCNSEDIVETGFLSSIIRNATSKARSWIATRMGGTAIAKQKAGQHVYYPLRDEFSVFKDTHSRQFFGGEEFRGYLLYKDKSPEFFQNPRFTVVPCSYFAVLSRWCTWRIGFRIRRSPEDVKNKENSWGIADADFPLCTDDCCHICSLSNLDSVTRTTEALRDESGAI